MVSIPDWSKFSRLLNTSKDDSASHSKYYKQREEEAIKDAEKSGYFVVPSQTLIIDRFLDKEHSEDILQWQASQPSRKKQLRQIQYIRLASAHLRMLGDIGTCLSLRVCVLCNNYITKFEALSSCRQLIKLDLHGNQITMVPDIPFWSSMKHLKIVYLHDNPIGRIENIHYLSTCSKLAHLTLFDTPLSLKKNYRHHVVNSIWSLKALDHYVISDEEIIEDADFGGMFAAMSESFHLDLHDHFNVQPPTYDHEMAGIRTLLYEVNRIMAYNSPVLLIQRYTRGFLTRKRYKIVQDTRIWAAVTIQREFRSWKSVPSSESGVRPIPPPPTSPAFGMVPPSTADSVSVKMDFDTYVQQMRRPESVSEISSSRGPATERINEEESIVVVSSTTSPDGTKAKKNIHIDLTKLQTGTLQSIADNSTALESALQSDRSYGIKESRHEAEAKRKARQKKRDERKSKPKRKVIPSVKQFLGPVVQQQSPWPSLEDDKEFLSDGEEIPFNNFRLCGMKETIQTIDPTTYLVFSKQEDGKDVRDADDDHHRQRLMMTKPTVKKSKLVSTDQRIFARVQGTMGLSCLQAVQQAYKDREKAEKNSAKMFYVLTMKDQRETGKERLKLYQNEKRMNILKQRDKDQRKMLDTLEKQEMRRLNYLHKAKEVRARSTQFSRNAHKERTFVQEFGIQNTSVSNALMRHDQLAHQEDNMQEKLEYTKQQRQIDKEQQDLVKKFMEHRQLMRQTETAMSRATLDTKMLQDANDRLMQTRTRVAQLKALRTQAQAMCPMPNSSTHSLPAVQSESIENMKGLDRWNSMVAAQAGRVGKHQVVATI